MTPMIIRTWRGWTRAADAADYEAYLMRTGFAEYTATPGNRGAYFTRRDAGERTEFFLITMWDSWEAVKAFAGEDPSVAVFYPEDERFLVGKELTVDHYDLFAST